MQDAIYAFLSVVISVILYLHYIGAEGDWAKIPYPLRFFVFPFYVFSVFYISQLFFQIYLFIPMGIELVFNYILGFFVLITGMEWLGTTWEFIGRVFGDITILPYMFCSIFIGAIMPNFKNEVKFTFYYRLVSLVLLSWMTIKLFAIDTPHDLSKLEGIIFSLVVAIAAIFSYMHILEEKRNGSADTEGVPAKLWNGLKLFFSKQNPLFSIEKWKGMIVKL